MISDQTGVDDPYRHRCEISDQMYHLGYALVFYDTQRRRWYTAFTENAAHQRWMADPSQPHALVARHQLLPRPCLPR